MCPLFQGLTHVMEYCCRSAYQRQQCAEGYEGNLCASCGTAADGTRYGFYTAFTCTKCKNDATLVRRTP